MPQVAAKDYAEVGQGEGKILEFDREKWAVSREEQDQVHVVSAVCTHMKCVVHWNDAEKPWDCPCHGSRFLPQGEVLEGPATRNLRPNYNKEV
ncbi:Rieske 2Fe-2S domain-containing protein [Legionella taurinensis]|uniref:Rieske 2Fe-2S domain-containing protein n=1 Tax=Legionella taurinensis TaxID=70611 RepID=UPI000E07F789|nr:Rieske 2Fe-2S domain-containing protein [Legionella taurinensis]MDX1837342.1 Rieske 2Fe-2S domain-containing protein [Legionella taurinensis]STY25687.1 Cytochrome b6-f complex iron-sulfur subunit [Legionella taurinensis]